MSAKKSLQCSMNSRKFEDHASFQLLGLVLLISLIAPLSLFVVAVSVGSGGSRCDIVHSSAPDILLSPTLSVGLRVVGDCPFDESLRKNNTGPSEGLWIL